MSSPDAFALGQEVEGGSWKRRQASFRDWVRADGSSPFPPEPGRYHLYLALACPWSHRVEVVRQLKGLTGVIGVSYAAPYRDERGWEFPGGEFTDEVEGFRYLSEAYERSRPGYEERVTVPVLWDTVTGRIVNNESADLVRMLGREFDEFSSDPDLDLYPEELAEEIDRLNEFVYANVNDGVYKCGFSESQEAYEEAFTNLFDSLARLEELLDERRYLAGDRMTEADWRLWVTLVRFDAVYHTHFRANGRRLIDHPNLWDYARELYQVDGVPGTVRMDQIKEHYYTTHDMLNPKRIIPLGPLDVDWSAPHRRDR
jgi:putative glutathione S-transferase